MPQDEDQRCPEVTGRELDASAHDPFVQHLCSGPDHREVTDPAIEDDLGCYPRVDAGHDSGDRVLLVAERAAPRQRVVGSAG